MASCPYTRKYGEFPNATFGVTLSAQRVFVRALCQFLWLSVTDLRIMQMRFLFEDSATPFPWG